jgi:hypothetical protein
MAAHQQAPDAPDSLDRPAQIEAPRVGDLRGCAPSYARGGSARGNGWRSWSLQGSWTSNVCLGSRTRTRHFAQWKFRQLRRPSPGCRSRIRSSDLSLPSTYPSGPTVLSSYTTGRQIVAKSSERRVSSVDEIKRRRGEGLLRLSGQPPTTNLIARSRGTWRRLSSLSRFSVARD